MVNPYAQYQVNSVMTATPQQLTLMLYNGAVKFCNLTIEGLVENDYQKAHNYNLRTQDIIVELQSTLDDKYPVAKQMSDMYSVILNILIDANLEKDKMKLEGARDILINYRDLWQEVMANATRG